MYSRSVFHWLSSTAGPMSTSPSRPGPTRIFRAWSSSRATSSSLAAPMAMTREVAVQRWPVEPKAPSRMATAALSRSQSGMTMTAFLPPISQVTLAPREAAFT